MINILNHPLVSIIVTTYNGEKFLAVQLDSIINQTYKNLEIFICDDASLDDTTKIIKQFAARDNRIKPVFHHKNIGLHANLENGLTLASGEYIAISDQDDIWLLDKIELLLTNIGENLAIFSDSALIDENTLPLNKTIMGALKIVDHKIAYTLLALLHQNCVSGHTLLFRKILLAYSLPFTKNTIFDHHFALIAATSNSLIIYPTPLVLHRLHTTNSTNGRFLNKDNKHKAKQVPLTETKRIRSQRMLERISLVLARHSFLQRHAQTDLSKREPHNVDSNNELCGYLSSIAVELQKFDAVFFNFSLLIQLLQIRRRYPGFKTFAIKRCLTLAKGAKWYRFFDHFYSAQPATIIAPGDVKPGDYYSQLRPRMATYLPADAKTCLDVGCGSGRFGQSLKEGAPQIEVWGIEIIGSVAEQAKDKLDRVLIGDAITLIDHLPNDYFDCVFFNDSLEHMVDPYSLLAAIKPKLKQKSGVVIASIPNIRHFSSLYNLLINKDWHYVESGVMDSTHLRFFTQKSIRRMFEEANYQVELLEGVSGSRKLRARIWSWLTLGWMGDIRFKQFAVVASTK